MSDYLIHKKDHMLNGVKSVEMYLEDNVRAHGLSMSDDRFFSQTIPAVKFHTPVSTKCISIAYPVFR
jgi:hypothetical protein